MQPSARCDDEETLGLIPRSFFIFLFPILKFSVLCNAFSFSDENKFSKFSKVIKLYLRFV